jgi:hypothetical protein
LRGTRNGLEKGRCLLCNEEEDTLHIILKCPEMRKLREHPVSRKWLTVNEEIACRKINCTNTLEIRNIGSYLFKIRCRWEKRIKELELHWE